MESVNFIKKFYFFIHQHGRLTKSTMLVLAVFLLFPFLHMFAATTDFTVRTFIGDGTLPPTVPGNFIAVPITTSQITLSWDASTDDFLLEGYHVWRDDVQIATTSATTYADIGLTASTTYTYYVTAYDSFFNESASSTIESATTFSIPLPPPTPTTTSSGSHTGTKLTPLDEMISSIEILPQMDSVTIRYVTKTNIHSIIKWGKTSSYELGSIAERAFGTLHEIHIAGLAPGTRYSFDIEGEERMGRYGILYDGQFTTLPPFDTFAPGNVTDFSAMKGGTDIVLTWVNPNDVDFSKVRIVESEQFYPNDIADGWVVYEGGGTNVHSVGKAIPGTTHYYTIFAYDSLGNISSGAVAELKIDAFGTVSTSTIPKVIDPTQNAINLSFNDLVFSQEGILIQNNNGTVQVEGSKQLTISIPYEMLPEHLKTILVVLGSSDGSGKQFTFILRTNVEKTAYTATIAPLGVTGDFPIAISVFDFKTAQVGYTHGVLASKIRSLHLDVEQQDFSTYMLGIMSKIGRSYLLWFIILLILMAYAGRRLIRTEV